MNCSFRTGGGRPARNRCHAISALLAVSLALLAPGLRAQTAAEESVEPTDPVPTSSVLSPEKEAMAQTLFNELISPCCWTTTVAQHGSGAAPRIQAEIRQMLARGKNHQEILDYYVAEFGERILAKPKKTGFNLAAYWVPYVALVFGAVVILLLVRRGVGRGRNPAGPEAVDDAASVSESDTKPEPAVGDDEAYRRRIEEELRKSS